MSKPYFIIFFLLIFGLGVLMGFGKIPFDLRSRALFVPAAIVVDAGSVGNPVNLGFYHAYAQGGEEATNMFAGLESNIAALRPAIIRIDHVYDYYNIVSRVSGSLQFNFSTLDQVLLSIRKTGATPLLALSYMPNVIAREGNIVSTPMNWDEWALVVQKTIEHISSTTANVYYEIWNEPDHPQFGGWKYYGAKNYLTLYNNAALGASRARGVRPFKLGGPSTTALYKAWIDALIKNGARVDFLSWHTYEMDPATYEKELEQVRLWSGEREFLVTEFGFSSSKDIRYGTSFAAAHTVAVVRAVINNPPNYLFSFELKDGPADTVGKGWGMWTYGGSPKPRVAVFSFLDQMSGNRLFLSGEGSRVTSFATINDGTIKILLVNFDGTWSSEAFPVTIKNISSGTYDLTYRRLFGPIQTVKETVSDSIWQKQIYLPAYGVMILELRKVL